MPVTCPDPSGKKVFLKGNWARTNLTYFPLGIIIGLCIYLLFSAFVGQWLSFRRLGSQLISACIITQSITNSIYFSQMLIRGKLHSLLSLFTYYVACAFGLFLGTELSYFTFHVLFDTPYRFFHSGDLLMGLCIMMIVCTALYVRGIQRESLVATLKEKELDLLRFKQINTQAELAALQARINPHFLYNALNGIASLIHSDPQKAETMTLLLSKLFRYSVSQAQENLVTVREELEIVNTYLEIEKIRFGTRIDFVLEVDPSLMGERMPRFLVQPLIENALKHGLNNITENGRLLISIQTAEKGIAIAVSDNGVPFPENYEIGYGLQSTYDKLELLYPGKHELYIRNTPVKEVVVIIPRSDG